MGLRVEGSDFRVWGVSLEFRVASRLQLATKSERERARERGRERQGKREREREGAVSGEQPRRTRTRASPHGWRKTLKGIGTSQGAMVLNESPQRGGWEPPWRELRHI